MLSNNTQLFGTSKIMKQDEDYWLSIPEPLLNALSLKEGQTVSVTVSQDQLIITTLTPSNPQDIKVLALDLEGTLISSAVSQIPRPGLFDFLQWCHDTFERVVMYTSVNEGKFREIAHTLVQSHDAPEWLVDIEYIHWYGSTKDLRFIPNMFPEQVILLDDCEMVINSDETSQWLPIKCFDPSVSKNPKSSVLDDNELENAIAKIKSRLDAKKFEYAKTQLESLTNSKLRE